MTDPTTTPVWLEYRTGMTRKRTFSLPDDLSTELDALAGGNASAYVTAAVRDRIARDRAARQIRDLYGEPDPQAYRYWVERLTGQTPPGPTSTPPAGLPGPQAPGRRRRAS